MTPARTGARSGAYTEVFGELYGPLFTEGLAAAAAAAAVGDFTQASILAERLRAGAGHLRHSVVRDAVGAGLDWWRLAELLGRHPQAVFDDYAHVLDHPTTPARQRPDLAVVCTAGLAAMHDLGAEHGVDVDNFDPDHSLNADPTVLRLRVAAQTLREDIWIAARLPGQYPDDDDHPDDLPDHAAITRWTTVVLHPAELGWLSEAPDV